MQNIESVWPKVVAKAWRNDVFRQQLLSDAGTALKEHFALDLPLGSSFKVVELGQAGGDTLVLPPAPNDLADGLLDQGGSNTPPPVCIC